MAAWRSSCPRLAIWEDALADGLVALDGQTVRLTAVGLARHAGTGLAGRAETAA